MALTDVSNVSRLNFQYMHTLDFSLLLDRNLDIAMPVKCVPDVTMAGRETFHRQS